MVVGDGVKIWWKGEITRNELLELLRRAVCDDFATVDDDGAGTCGLDFLQDVGGEDDGLVLAHALDHAAHLMLLVGIEAVRRLVEDEHVGVMNDALGEAGAVTVPLGERVHALIAHAVEEAQVQHTVDRLRALRTVQPAHLGAEAEEARHRHVGVERRVFRQITEALFRLLGVLQHVNAAQADAAAGGAEVACDHAHGGRFAGAVRPEEAEHFSFFHGEGNIIDGHLGAEYLDEVFDLDHNVVGSVGWELTPQGGGHVSRVLRTFNRGAVF
jgi:hypothetical protein